MANNASLVILSQSDSEAPRSLEKLLRGRSREPGIEVQQMVDGIYLALLDCYEESGNVWCHGMAVSGLHRVGMYIAYIAFSLTYKLNMDGEKNIVLSKGESCGEVAGRNSNCRWSIHANYSPKMRHFQFSGQSYT